MSERSVNLRKFGSFLLRAAITAGAIYYAFSQVDVHRLLPLLADMSVLPLMAAVLFLHLAQYASALRMRFYLHCQGVDFGIRPALMLHYVGGLFNALLPGGAGGDVYKAWWLGRYTSGKLLHLVKLMIASRLNGMWTLGVLICVLAALSPALREAAPAALAQIGLTSPAINPLTIAIATIIAGTIGYHLLARFILREPLAQQYRAGVYSAVIQLSLFVCSWFLAVALHIDAARLEYLLLFQLSCILAMLPISVGGIGVREIALLYGTKLLALSDQQGVALAFSFSVINLSVPLIGAIVYSLWKPQKREVVPV